MYAQAGDTSDVASSAAAAAAAAAKKTKKKTMPSHEKLGEYIDQIAHRFIRSGKSDNELRQAFVDMNVLSKEDNERLLNDEDLWNNIRKKSMIRKDRPRKGISKLHCKHCCDDPKTCKCGTDTACVCQTNFTVYG
jgi:hypothetical protein